MHVHVAALNPATAAALPKATPFDPSTGRGWADVTADLASICKNCKVSATYVSGAVVGGAGAIDHVLAAKTWVPDQLPLSCSEMLKKHY